MSRDEVIEKTLDILAQNYYTSMTPNEQAKTNNYADEFIKQSVRPEGIERQHYKDFYEQRKIDYKPTPEDDQC